MLSKVGEDSFEGLAMIDAMQRLAIDYHFQEEIASILERHYMKPSINANDDLHQVALRFRLLRQQGYSVSAGCFFFLVLFIYYYLFVLFFYFLNHFIVFFGGYLYNNVLGTGVFDNFKESEGKFKQKLSGDIKGLMGLYEASQLSIRGEDTLGEAGEYSYQLLNSWLTHLDYHQARVAGNTLEHPHHKSLAKFMAKNFFNDLHGSYGWMKALKDLAKSEFKITQSQHQKEIVEIGK